jgi:alginate O-acetyltransferase complex protein AlgI
VLFPTITFAIFFLLVYAASWLLMPHFRLWKWMIVAASYVFYGWWDWRFPLLLVAATLANQWFGVRVARARTGARGRHAGRSWLVLAVIVDLAALGYFKYYDFFAADLDDLLHTLRLGMPLPLLRIVLPVGISFLVFRMLSYVIDIYRDQLAPAPLPDYAVYTAFFPYLLAGPIARARDFLPQLASPRDPRAVDSGQAFTRILLGLAKKMLIADYLATHIVSGLFASPQQYSSWEALVGICAFSAQIYCDFSGYTDIAIGVSLLLGFELPENFAAPYTARTVQDFWRRWHMTFSSWLRDYLYIPLGGNRKGPRRTSLNLIVTMLLGGLWHGANWTFVVWGGMHGVGLAVGRARARVRRARGLPEPGATVGARARQRLAVFAFVTVAWVFFRADSVGTALAVLWRLIAGLGSLGSAVTLPVVLLTVLGVGMQYIPATVLARVEAAVARIGWVGQAAVLAFGLFLVDVLGPLGTAEFLYFKF